MSKRFLFNPYLVSDKSFDVYVDKDPHNFIDILYQ